MLLGDSGSNWYDNAIVWFCYLSAGGDRGCLVTYMLGVELANFLRSHMHERQSCGVAKRARLYDAHCN